MSGEAGLGLAVALLLAAGSDARRQQAFSSEREASAKPRILVFTKTAGFRHDSIPAAIAGIRRLGVANGLSVDATEDSGAFTNTQLARYNAVVFLLTTGDVLDGNQQRVFERFIRRGGGFAGVHSAADIGYAWAWYGDLVGAYFKSHPSVQRASVRVVARHPSLGAADAGTSVNRLIPALI